VLDLGGVRTWIAVVLTAAACNCEGAVEPARRTAPGPGPEASADSAPGGHARMLDLAVDLQRAIAHGRLADARDLASALAVAPMPTELVAYQTELRAAAARVRRAPDVATAGAALGPLGRACGRCHEAARATLAFTFGEPPASGAGDVPSQMHAHQWAAARLWEGLVGPADTAWHEGARVLADAPLEIRAMFQEVPITEVAVLAERLRVQARDALDAPTDGPRARIYGEIVRTCASCHAIVRPHAVPPPPPPSLVSSR
jgi:hypothetical protein